MSTAQGDRDLGEIIDETYKEVSTARDEVNAAQTSRSTKIVDKAGEWYGTAEGKVTAVQGVLAEARPVYESEMMKTVRESINAFAEGLPGVLKALDEVAKIHPFVQVAVSAFRVVVELDMKRRDNEKKITVLFVEMKDMMEVLTQLRDIKDVDTPGPDGTTIKARIQGLIMRTADDIKDCANTCDAYAKKKLLVKVLKSSSWDEKLKAFLTLFTNRRKAFAFALEMHVGKGVDDANRKLDALDAKLSALLDLFGTLVPAEQQQLREQVQRRGGPEAVVRDEEALKELAAFKPVSGSAMTKRAALHMETVRSENDEREELKMLKEELFDSTDAAVQKNLELFERKFAMQQMQLTRRIQDTVRHESDRVIDSVLSGPHENIKDRDIYEIWKDMRWRGHVKARHLVLALRDHYLHQAGGTGIEGPGNAHRAAPKDLWALEYINVNDVGAISEAFDDDASGFVTIAEVNEFTSSRPAGWSLPHWIAYWTKGWRIMMARYRDKIDSLFAEMFAMVPRIRAENRTLAFKYLDEVWGDVAMLTTSLRIDDEDEDGAEDHLWERFEPYITSELERLKEGLETFQYRIDARDTLLLITGPGRIEKFLFPLLYLLVSRHHQIFRLCEAKVIIHHAELEDCADSILTVMDVVEQRCDILEGLFRQRNLNPKRQFENFACALYQIWHNPDELWTVKKLMDTEFSEAEYNSRAGQPLPDPRSILIYPTAFKDLSAAEDDMLSDDDLGASEIVKDMLGRWHGFFEDQGYWPGFPMFTFFLHSSGGQTFTGRTVTASGEACTISGQVVGGEKKRVKITSTWTFGGSFDTWCLNGILSEDKQSVSGSWRYGNDGDGECQAFYLTRLPPEVLVARPPPWEFKPNRTTALWDFALAYARGLVRNTSSWDYIKDFTDRRDRYVDILLKDEDPDESDSELMTDDEDEREELERSFTYMQASVCHLIVDRKQRAAETIEVYECDVCGENIHGAYYTCIQCSIEVDDSVDICDKPACRSATATIDDTTHLPTHDMIKLRRTMFLYHDLPKLFRSAKETLAKTRILFRAASDGVRLDADSLRDDVSDADSTADHQSLRSRDSHGAAQTPRKTVANRSDGQGGRGASSPSTKRRTRRPPKTAIAVPRCTSCSKVVQQPCFVCLECSDDVFICKTCDEPPSGMSIGNHDPSHALVRCMPPLPSEGLGSLERRLHDLLESQAASHARQIAALNERMSKVEQLLQTLAARQDFEQ